DAMVTYAPTPAPGVWQPTPPNNAPAANAHVPLIPPFVLPDSSYFRAPPPPALTDTLYTEDYNYTKLVGASDPEANGNRTHEQTNQALDWRLPLVNLQTWNRITQEVAAAQGTTVPQSARLFALLDMAINDGLETSFNNKFYYGLWRPVTAIIHGGLGGANDTDGDPLADGNPDTVGDAHWLPLHPTTPAYPTYTGNAATIGAASATVLSSFFGTNDITFQVHWAYSGETRTYPGFWTAAQEEADSRIFGGIHFRFDTVGGQWVGSHVADYVFNHVLLPVSPGDENDDAMGAAALAAAAPNAAPDFSFLAGALTASPASSLAAGVSSIPAPKENQPTIPVAAKAQPSSTSQPLDQPTHSVARSTELDALFADLGGYALADGL
ncbi:MAG TPA: vanadium-dependent haloperoxidase, partial [Gemmataceae bacterium]|nr:vanadium-dependent haloperoxidase [Gemmataceae bacterium]